jgi:hypothetical protein
LWFEFIVNHIVWNKRKQIWWQKLYHKKHMLLSLVFTFLLAYTRCARGFHCDIYINAYIVPWIDSSPLYHSPSSFSLLLKTWQVFLFYFHISIETTSTMFIFLHPFHSPSPLLLVPTPEQNLFYISVLHFLKWILII